MNKTNVMRMLEQADIVYTPLQYEIKEGDFSGEAVSALTGVPAGQTYKTLCVTGGKKGTGVFVVPVDKTLSLKKAARALGDKNVTMLKSTELMALTGYVRGCVSPVGMKKQYPTYIDESAKGHNSIAISAGAKGYSLMISPETLCGFLRSSFADLCEE